MAVRDGNRPEVEALSCSQGVDFCDLGIVPVAVTVGPEGCNQVTVKDVPVNYRETLNLLVVYDPVACRHEGPRLGRPPCRILLRVLEGDGWNWLAGAAVKSSSVKDGSVTDSAGRLLINAHRGDHIVGLVQLNGYETARFTYDCLGLSSDHELLIRLR